MNKLTQFWNFLTLPTFIDNTSYRVQTKERQARFISRFLLLFFGLSVVAFCIEILVRSSYARGNQLYMPLYGIVAFTIIALCNRIGLVRLAGMLLVGVVISALVLDVVNAAPLDVTHLPLFELFSISLLVAGLLLPPAMIFVVAILNCIIIAFLLYFLPLAPNLHTYLYNDPIALFFSPVALNIEIALTAYIVVFSLTREVKRANRAEEILRLKEQLDTERRLLKEAVEQISLVLEMVAHGHFQARAPIEEGNVLGSIAFPLNSLLDKTQAWKKDAEQYQQLAQAITTLAQYLKQKQQHPDILPPAQSGTAADQLLPVFCSPGESLLFDGQKDQFLH